MRDEALLLVLASRREISIHIEEIIVGIQISKEANIVEFVDSEDSINIVSGCDLHE